MKAGPLDPSVGIALESFSGTLDPTTGALETTGSINVFLDLQEGANINALGETLLGVPTATSSATITTPFDFVGNLMGIIGSRLATLSSSVLLSEATTTNSNTSSPTADGVERWMVLFATQDKGSGMDHYEVREVDPLLPWWGSGWHVAESPYLLEDQTLRSAVYVRAYDNDGNVREESLAATYGPTLLRKIILIALCIVALLAIIFAVRFLKRLLW
jgi:hypothetical protein